VENDPLKDQTPGQRVRTHIQVVRTLLSDLDEKVSSRWTVDQIMAAAQIHALLAIATALGDPDVRR
jgi:hypothetical protein